MKVFYCLAFCLLAAGNIAKELLSSLSFLPHEESVKMKFVNEKGRGKVKIVLGDIYNREQSMSRLKSEGTTEMNLYNKLVDTILANYVPICKRTSSTLNQCLKMAATVLQPYLAKGIKELNIPALEPLEIPMVKLEQGTGAVSYKATISKIKLYGLSNYKFDDFRASFGKNVLISGRTNLPMIRLVADYDINGKILLLPIQGNGEFTANITECRAEFVTMSDFVKRKGTEYLQNKDTRLQLEIGGAMVNFDNLFNGDPVLSKTTNAFFNDNAKDILNEVKPAIEAVAGMLIDDILSKVFKSASYDKLFPK